MFLIFETIEVPATHPKSKGGQWIFRGIRQQRGYCIHEADRVIGKARGFTACSDFLAY